jgi:hypothetical protein
MTDWEEPKKELKPRYGGAIYCEDPDTGEVIGAPSLEPRTLLAGEMLETVRPGSPCFHDHREMAAWYKLESKPPPDVDINTWYDWIRNRLWCAQEFSMSYQKLIKAIKNEDKFRDWRARQT